MEQEYLYFLSIKNICEDCGYDHVEAGVKPVIIMEPEACGAWCRNCGKNMHPTVVKPSMKDFYDNQMPT